MNRMNKPAHRKVRPVWNNIREAVSKHARPTAAVMAVSGLVLIGIATGGSAQAATGGSGITGPDSNGYCYTSTPLTQNEYTKTVPGHAETTHNEYKYKQVTTVYSIEHKDTGLPSGDPTDVIAWYGSIGAPDAGGSYYQLPDAVVAAAGVNPFTVAKTGNVDLHFYGYPGHATVPYKITGIDISTTPPAGNLFVTNTNTTLYYTGSGIGSTDSADAVYTATNPGSPWVQFGTAKVVGNGDAVPDVTYYYLTGGGQDTTVPNTDLTVDDAHWTTDAMPSGWTLLHTRQTSSNTKVTCPVAPPIKCMVTNSTWAPDAGDLPWTLQNDGAHFDAATTASIAQDMHQTATGNMQGLTGKTITATNTHGYTARGIVIVSPNEVIPNGTSSSYSTYATISTATETVDGVNNLDNALWYTSRIQHDKPGGMDNPVTWDQMIAIMPNNTLYTPLALHKQTNASTSDTSTIQSVSSSCGSSNFVTTVDAATPQATITSQCLVASVGSTGSTNASEVTVMLSNPWTASANHVGTPANFRISVDGGVAQAVGTTIQPNGPSQTITSAQDSELSFPAGSGSHTVVVKSNQLGIIAQATVNADDCDTEVTFVAPTPPVNNVCAADGTLTKGSVETFADLQKAQPTGVILTLNADGQTGTVTADTGYKLALGSATTFDLGKVSGPTDCPKKLALTGKDDGGLLSLGFVLLLGGIALAVRHRPRTVKVK